MITRFFIPYMNEMGKKRNIQKQHQMRYFELQNESSRELTVLFVLHKLILQTRMRRHTVGLAV